MKSSLHPFTDSGWQLVSRILLIGIAISLSVIFLHLQLALQPAFDSDEYLHASPGLDLKIFLERGEVGSFLSRLSREVFYPPLHPLLLSFFFSIFGSTVTAARVFSWILFLGSVAFTAGAVRRILKNLGILRDDATLFASLLALLCPAAFLSSILCMLEPLGMFIVSAILFVLADEKAHSLRQAICLGLLFAAAALTKHTLPLLLFPGTLLASLVGNSSEERLWTIRERNLAVAFVLLGSIWIIWAFGVSSGALYRFLFGHHARGYTLGLYENTSYFRSLFLDFHFMAPLAVVNLFFALFAVFRKGSCYVVRVAGFSLLCSMVMLGFVAEQGYRHLSMLSPCLFLLGGVGYAEFFHSFVAHSKERSRYLGLLLFTLTFLLFGSVLYFHQEIRSMMFTQLEIKPEQDEALEALEEALPFGESYLVIGNDNLAFSYHLLWKLAARYSMTVHEARSLRKVLSEELEGAVKRARRKEIAEVFNKIHDRYDSSHIVVIGRKRSGDPDGVRGHHVDRIEKSLCGEEEESCRRFETSQFSVLRMSMP